MEDDLMEVIDSLRESLDRVEGRHWRLVLKAKRVVTSQDLVTREDGHLYGVIPAGLLYELLKELENGV